MLNQLEYQTALDRAVECWEAEHPESEEPETPLTCGQCHHFRPTSRDYVNGCCEIRRVMGYGYGDISTLEPRFSGDRACPKILVSCPF